MRSVDDLLGDADIAMYQAKALGKGRYQVFSATGAATREPHGPAPGSSAVRPSAAAVPAASPGRVWNPGRARLGSDGIRRRRSSRIANEESHGDPALSAAHGPLPRHRRSPARLRGALPGPDPALPRHRRAVRGRAHPRRSRGRGRAGRWRWPGSGRWSRSARPAATRTAATTSSRPPPGGSPSIPSILLASRTSWPT